MTKRFKIDIYLSSYRPFGLYFAERSLFGMKWKQIDSFEDREKALAFYEKIKDLPQYLD
jgi:hypothetical protein